MPLDADTWNDRYLRREMGWDKGRCAPPIARMLAEGLLPASALVAVVGAGRGFEAIEASRFFQRVTAIDFAPEAVKAMHEAKAAAGFAFTPLLADVLTLHQTHPRAFDAIVEHTCYCAIDPSQRDAYVTAVSGALAPGGLLLGLFYNHGRSGGPPFDTSEADVRGRFVDFTFERFVKARDSFPGRVGEEWEFVLRRKG
ncbi:MAG: methyltransferase domain-containing protein [Myxococcaceae bacterium]|nr:methyltransferase domain-containing protein [Myxococcaceae bacterium]